MSRKTVVALLMLKGAVLPASCNPLQISPISQAEMPKPASVYGVQNGGRLDFGQDGSGGVAGLCVYPNGNECDEWAYFRGECGPATQCISPSAPTEIPTALPIDPVDYQGGWADTHPVYSFSILLPEDWIIEEVTTSDPLMNGQMLSLHPRYDIAKESTRMTSRRVGGDARLWPAG